MRTLLIIIRQKRYGVRRDDARVQDQENHDPIPSEHAQQALMGDEERRQDTYTALKGE